MRNSLARACFLTGLRPRQLSSCGVGILPTIHTREGNKQQISWLFRITPSFLHILSLAKALSVLDNSPARPVAFHPHILSSSSLTRLLALNFIPTCRLKLTANRRMGERCDTSSYLPNRAGTQAPVFCCPSPIPSHLWPDAYRVDRRAATSLYKPSRYAYICT